MSNTDYDNGVFVISIDFELLWGVWDVTSEERYGANILGVKEVIPALLNLFATYDIKATFATVGILFANDKSELFSYLPESKPGYTNPNYDVYAREFKRLGDNETDDPYHFGYSLFEQLKNSPHEIGTHTFCHYYCLEKGQTADEFDADIKVAKKIAEAKGIKLNSIVFPRNQVNKEYLQVLRNNDINVYRGNPDSWIYKPRRFAAEGLLIRLSRLVDAYFPVSGYNTYPLTRQQGKPVNIPASRFMKPYFKPLGWFERLRLNRIKKGMTHAAQNKELYHLWWHPHNFGQNLDRNILNLTILLQHYQELNRQYGFTCCTMEEAGRLLSTDT
ncbi:MAG: polysaccharide deacetylase family protein [Ferruginibacter sp.]